MLINAHSTFDSRARNAQASNELVLIIGRPLSVWAVCLSLTQQAM